MRTWLAILTAFALAFALARPAAADTPVDPSTQAKADVLFEQAQAHYKSGEYQAAIQLFKAAYDLVHDPVYLFNAAQSYRKVLDCEAAFDYYNRYLAQATDAKNRAKVEQWLTELSPCVEQRKQEREQAARGAEAERQRQAEARREGAAPKRTVADQGKTYRRAGIAAGGVGALGLIVGIGYSLHGSSVTRDVASACNPTCVWDDQAVADEAGRHANTMAKVGFVGGGVAAIAGAVLYLLGRSKAETVQFTPAPGGGVVSAHVEF